MLYKSIIFLLILFIVQSCQQASTPTPSTKFPTCVTTKGSKKAQSNEKSHGITCTDRMCQGMYSGPEFVKGSDVAHQFSNTMATAVGNKLKELYDKGLYSKVDFNQIVMSTEGMGTGQVNYALTIPFIQVDSKCEARTSFDHVGGWRHTPALAQRKKQLQKALLPGDPLDISDLKTTKEGLEEHWIQWRNKKKQKACVTKQN